MILSKLAFKINRQARLSTFGYVDNVWICGENYFPFWRLFSFPFSLFFSIFVPLLLKLRVKI